MSKSATQVGPLVCLWPERMLYIGRLSKVSSHRHAATVCVLALEGEVRVRMVPSKEWQTGRSVLIAAGQVHALDMRDGLVAVLYNDPHQPFYRLLAARGENELTALDSTAESKLVTALRDFYFTDAGEMTLDQIEQAADQALGVYSSQPIIDSRILNTINMIQSDLTQNQSLDELAGAVGLSPGRLQHLFSEEIGVPLRRFRMWIRFRHTLESFAKGASFTFAALDAGFSNSAHFSHTFKATFGVSAFSVLKAGVMPRVIVAP